MSAPPPAVEQRLSALVPRVRALRVTRGACRLVVAALATTSAVLLLDAGFPLPAQVRGLFLSFWLTAIGVLAWRWVLVPWRGPIALSEVARELGKHLPGLGERLHAVVTDDPTAGPSAVRAAVAEDTARRTKVVDLTRALPWGEVVRHATVAGATVLAVALTVTLVPGSSDRLRRVALPWHRGGTATFRVMVTSGEPIVKRGGPVTLSAYPERTGAGSAGAVLVTRDAPNAAETRLTMTGDGSGFHATVPRVTADFEYCVEIGSARSEWFHVSAVDAAELAEGTCTEIAAPDYAKRPKRVITGLADFDGLQFGTVNFRLAFTVPVAAAHFDWRADGAGKSELFSLELAPDKCGATCAFPLSAGGVLRLILVHEANGKKLRAETAVAVRVAQDEPPWFEELSGVTIRPRTVQPGGRVPVRFVARDDMSVTGAELQYIVGAGERNATSIPIPLTGAGAPRAVGQLDFDLMGLAREGDVIRFRLRLLDNRTVETLKLAPQETYYPSSGWSEIRVRATAPPLDEQDIGCQRDATHDALTTALGGVNELAIEVEALRGETNGRSALAGDQTVRLNNAHERALAEVGRLAAAARDVNMTPELRALADGMRAAAERHLLLAEDAIRRAETDDPTARKDALAAAASSLSEASARLKNLIASNARLGGDRLDRVKLITLGTDQAQLADAKTEAADALARQRGLLDRLVTVVADSDTLTRAVTGARGEEVRRLATDLAELAALTRDLDAAAKQTAADTRAALVATLTRDLDAFTERAARAFSRADTAARLAGIVLPAPADFRRIGDLAAAGRTVDALAELEKQARTIDRIATTFDSWQVERADAKFAARQLVRWQDDIQARYLAAVTAGGYRKLADDAKAALRAEQTALHAAVQALAIPAEDATKGIRDNAARHAEQASKCLALDGFGADEAMKLVSDVLTQLSERTPTVPERLTKSLRELEKLRLELDTSGNAVEGALKGAGSPDSKKFAPQIDKQRPLIAAVLALDLPGLGTRQARVALALKTAVSDLQEGTPLDIQVSQAWARREVERLKLVLEGYPPPDSKVEELYHKMLAAAGVLDALGPMITKLGTEPVLPVIQDVQSQLALVVAPEAPALLNDARNAVQAAETAFRDAKPDAIRLRVRAAADALSRLVDRLDGSESDLDRVRRLATARRLTTKLAADKLKELLAAEETYRQFGREADELAATRVGAAGQVLKRRALDLYSRLRTKADLDRAGSDLKSLATALEDLAGKMAEVAELAAGVGRARPTVLPAAEQYLPSKALADTVRELAESYRTVHIRVTKLEAELATRLLPAKTNPFVALEEKQRALAADTSALAKRLSLLPATNATAVASRAADLLLVARVPTAKEAAEHAANFYRQLATIGADKSWGPQANGLVTRQDALIAEMSELLGASNAAAAQHVARADELARVSSELAARLTRTAHAFDADDPCHDALTVAAKTLVTAGKRLTESAKKATAGTVREADLYRSAAAVQTQAAAQKITPVVPTGSGVPPGLALRTAERRMQDAIEALIRGDESAARKAMRDSAATLRDAANDVGK